AVDQSIMDESRYTRVDSSSSSSSSDVDSPIPNAVTDDSHLPLSQTEFFSGLSASGLFSQEVLGAVMGPSPTLSTTGLNSTPERESAPGPEPSDAENASEHDDAVWVPIGGYGPTNYDRRSLTTPGEPVNVAIVDSWLILLYNRFRASMREPEPAALPTWSNADGTARHYTPPATSSLTVLQPIHNGGGHFVAAVRLSGQLLYIDSLNLPINDRTRQALIDLFGPNNMYIRLGVQRQGGDGNLCGLHVLAHITELMLSNRTPAEVAATNFDDSLMRVHAFRCLEDGE
ncbi:hypothetical protein FOZ62_001434, partial [Perkinsus olseni]